MSARILVSCVVISRKLAGMAQSEVAATSPVPKIARKAKGVSSRNPDMPVAHITTSSLSPFSLLSVNSTAMKMAIGAITITSEGMVRPVTARKIHSVCPLVAIRST